MKTFEEIFASIIKAEKGAWTEENEINFNEIIEDDSTLITQDKEEKTVEELIKQEKIMNIIFEELLEQVKAGKKELTAKIPIEEYSFIKNRCLFQNKIMFKLKRQLPSYCISAKFNVYEYNYPYNNTYSFEVVVRK